MTEFARARDLYEELAPFSGEAAARLSELQVMVGGKKPVKKAAPPKAKPKMEKPSEGKAVKKEKRQAAPQKKLKKDKISYV